MGFFQYVRSKHRFLLIAFSGLFCLLTGSRYLWLAVGPDSWGPRFACAEPLYHCGEVSAIRTIEHEFVIGNSGWQTLHILKAAPGCGSCSTVEVSKKEIAPGDTSIVKVVIGAGKLAKGKFEQRLLVKTDASNAPKVILFVQGTIVNDGKAIQLTPHVLKEPVLVENLNDDLSKLKITSPIALSGLLHATHLFGFDMPVLQSAASPDSVTALNVILDHSLSRRYFGEATLVATRDGVRCRLTKSRNIRLQPAGVVHSHQLLALLAMHCVPLDTPLTTAQGKGHVRDILTDALTNFSPRQAELEWATIAFALYLAPQRSWQDKFGEAISFDDLAQRLLTTSLDSSGLACEGIHVLQALTILLAVDQQQPILSNHVRSATRQYLTDHVRMIVRHRQPTGAFEPLWHANAEVRKAAAAGADSRETLRRALVVTGHNLEWMLLLPPDMRPDDAIFSEAGRWLARQLRLAAPKEIEEHYCPYSHAGYMVQLLSTRATSTPRNFVHTTDQLGKK